MRNPLDSKRGRLATFFFLYVTEGIPLGFTATAIATYMRRQGLGPKEIGAFIASFYLPWGFKWVMGPVVDVFYSDRFGRRRLWIVACQILMTLTLVSTVRIDFVKNLGLFTWVLLVHNIFGATQDVAIDALAVSVLKEDERGVANGLMFAGANVGQAIGGSGVLFLTPFVGFKPAFFFVGAAISAVTALVAWRIKEPPAPRLAEDGRSPGWKLIGSEIRRYVATAGKSMFGNRPALAGLAFAVLPAGSYALSLSVGTNLPVEFGMSDHAIGTLGLVSVFHSAGGCVLGGYLSDRFGRRRTTALYIVLTIVPTLAVALAMSRAGWIMPINTTAQTRPAAPVWLVWAFMVASVVFAFFNGLMYGSRSALFMDVCNPVVAATQFTAYMAILNLVISYSARWQGWAADRWGYPRTLLLDAGFGLVCLAFLPLMRPINPTPELDSEKERGFEVVAA
jgi:MFS transporter, PAT family, beta-lactamase induction signal transducer AmpG